MSNKGKMYLIGITGFIVLIILFLLYFGGEREKEYFVKLGYDEIMEKINNKEDFVLCVSASTCSHCASYKPKLKEVAEEYKIEIYYTDIDLFNDENQDDFEDKYRIDGTPTTLFFNDGKEDSIMTRLEGDNSKDKIISNLIKHGFLNE